MLVIISYDIQDDRKRTRLAKKLLNYGPRVQKSVFEADVHAEELQRLCGMLQKVTLNQDESIRLYRVCAACAEKTLIWGSGCVTQDADFYIV